MSNLIRGKEEFLLNSISPAEVGMFYEGNVTTGVKHLVFKTLGIDIKAGSTVIIANAQTGNLQKRTLAFNWVWNGESEKVFEVDVIKEPLIDGWTNHETPIKHFYNFRMKAFTTTTPGTLNDTDKGTILAGLVAAVTADLPRTANAINSGAVVNATISGTSLVLEAKTMEVNFTVQSEQFTQTENVAFKKPTLTRDDIMRIFSVKDYKAGQYPVAPLANTEYVKIIITTHADGYDNTSASASNVRNKQFDIYMPVSQLTTTVFADIAVASGGAVPSMADTVGSPTKKLIDYLTYIADTATSLLT